MSDFTFIEYDECPKYDVFRKYLDRTLKKYNFKARYDDNKGVVKLEKNNELISIDFTNINKVFKTILQDLNYHFHKRERPQ
jgi:hypothetical protein